MRLVKGLVKYRLLGCMGQVLQWVSGKERNQDWNKGTRNKVSSDKELTEVGRMVEGD